MKNIYHNFYRKIIFNASALLFNHTDIHLNYNMLYINLHINNCSLSDKNVNSLFRRGFLSYSIHKNILFTILSYTNHIWAFFLAESILLLYIAALFPSNLSDTSLLQA